MSEIMKAVLFLVKNVTGREIPYKYDRDIEGVYYCWIEELAGLWGTGSTLAEAESDMIDTLKEGCEIYIGRLGELKDAEERIGLIMQIVMTDRQELLRCLHGKSCADI